MLNFFIYHFFVHDAVTDKRQQVFLIKNTCLRHFEVESAVRSADWGISGSPVRHENTLESPHVPEHIDIHILVLSGMDAVYEVVRVHDRTHTALFYGLFERHEIDFVQCPLVHIGTDGMSGPFLAIYCKMLNASHNALALNTFNISHSCFT